ncbi:MAG: hypothetical protein IAG10_33085 [Planctomycetaceae bacterium]|nr:hypothetical protein [Planctomycetaceae bacterium]
MDRVALYKRHHSMLALLTVAALCGCVSVSSATGSDAPDYARDPTVAFKAADSHERAMQIWRTAEDVNAWIAANFLYDSSRAIRLSETQRSKQAPLAIYSPSEFFDGKSGVCVDLARFAVETLKQIDPESEPKYVVIEFDPMQIEGNTLRLHWLVSFKRAGQLYFFADSKRPGYIAGPYSDTQAFIDEYQRYRARTIVAFRELLSYQKHRRERALRSAATQTSTASGL